MTQKTKVYAPEGYHFMVKKNGSFYLQIKDYTPHTLSNGDKSSPYVMMQYSTAHPSDKIGEASTVSTTPSRTVSPTTTTVRRTSNTTTPRSTTSSSSSGGSSSGGGYSGGY